MTMRIRTIALPTAAVLFCSAFVGCSDRGMPNISVQMGSTKKDPKRMSMGELQQYASTSAVVAVAETGTSLTQRPSSTSSSTTPQVSEVEREETVPLKYQANALQPPSPMVPIKPINVPEMTKPQNKGNPPVAKDQFANAELALYRSGFKIEGIRSGLFVNEQDAQRDALNEASKRIYEKLRQLDHPIYIPPLLPYEAAKYLVPNSGKVIPLSQEDAEIIKKSAVPSNNIRYQLDIELSDNQIRLLRGYVRVRDILPFVIIFLALAGGANLLLRFTGIAVSAVRRTVA